MAQQSGIPLAVLGQEHDVFQTKWKNMLGSFADELCIRKSRTSFESDFQHLGFVLSLLNVFSSVAHVKGNSQKVVCSLFMGKTTVRLLPQSPSVQQALHGGGAGNISSCLELPGGYQDRFRSGICPLQSHLVAIPIQTAILNRARECLSFMALSLW